MKKDILKNETTCNEQLSKLDLLYIYGGTDPVNPGEPGDEGDDGLIINIGKSCPTWGNCKRIC